MLNRFVQIGLFFLIFGWIMTDYREKLFFSLSNLVCYLELTGLLNARL